MKAPRLPKLEALARVDGLGRKALIGSGYAGFFFFCFGLFCYWTFPYDRVKDFVLQRANAGTGVAKDGGYQLGIGELEPNWLTGVEASDVTITPAGADDDQVLRLASVTANVSPFAYLTGTTEVDFGAVVGEGELEGTYALAESGKRIDLELDEVDLGALGLDALAGAPVTGRMSGEVHLDLPEMASAASGNVDLRIEDFTLGDGKGKLKLPAMRDGFTVDKIDAGTLTLKSTIAEGIAAIETFDAKGKDLKLKAGGSIRLGYPLSRSRLNMTLDLAFDDAYKTRSERTKSLFELMSFRPEIKRATGADGTMRFKLTGAVATLQARPAGTRGAAARRPAKTKPRKRPKPKAR